jgi:LmbE family N-acetylglucosaminyl deacetylase
MIGRLSLPSRLDLLCIGAHADDIEIGAGGTVLRLAGEGRLRSVHWVVLSAAGLRADEARAAAASFLAAGGADVQTTIGAARDGYFPASFAELKDGFEALKVEFEPNLILTHRRDDLHQDHRLVGELTWNTYRHHTILEYEIPKYDADLVSPNVLVELPATIVEQKCELLEAAYPSQRGRTWFTAETFRGLARVRGVEAAASSGYAEGFVGRKLTV